MSERTAPAGWYDEPGTENMRRYWDGQQWTSHRQEREPAPTLEPPHGWVWFWVFLFPPVGLIWGIYLVDKEPAKGAQVAIASLVVALVYVGLWLTK